MYLWVTGNNTDKPFLLYLFIYLFFDKLKETKKYSEIKMYNKQYIIHICKRSKDCLFLDKGLALVDKTLTLQSEDLIWL